MRVKVVADIAGGDTVVYFAVNRNLPSRLGFSQSHCVGGFGSGRSRLRGPSMNVRPTAVCRLGLPAHRRA
jgi:hypothetical protein